MDMSNNGTTKSLYCGDGLDTFHTRYTGVHGYVSLIVCLFGSIANGLNIAVLTRPEMRSPTNAILTGLAIADLLVMIDYIPYAFINYILATMNYSREQRLSYTATWFVMFHSIVSQTFHTVAIWLTVLLAVWRYIAVAHPQKNQLWCGIRTTIGAIISAYVICPFLSVPLYLAFSITPKVEQLDGDGQPWRTGNVGEARNVTLYVLRNSELSTRNPDLLWISLWVYSLIIKLIPCIALTVLSQRLINALLDAKRRRRHLLGNTNGMQLLSHEKHTKRTTGSSDKERQTDRTTRMLVAVLLLFLLTEFPQGILGVLSVLSNAFFVNCYLKLGEFLDILALVNSAINFILYCTMSRQFRKTFGILFRPKFFDRWLPVAQDGSSDMPADRCTGTTRLRSVATTNHGGGQTTVVTQL